MHVNLDSLIASLSLVICLTINNNIASGYRLQRLSGGTRASRKDRELKHCGPYNTDYHGVSLSGL